VAACATFNPSRVFPVFRTRGTLKVGAPADVAVLELKEGTFEFVDNFANNRTGRHHDASSACDYGRDIRGGRAFRRRPGAR
jgi:predicted amidohydrolase